MTNAFDFSRIREMGRLAGIRVVIVEDHALLAQSLRVGLAAEGAEACVVPLRDPDQVVFDCSAAKPDFVLLDLSLGGRVSDGDALIPRLAADGLSVLVMTGVTDPVRLAACVDSGALAVVPKTEDLDAVVNRLCASAGGGRAMQARERLDLMLRARHERHERNRELAPFADLTDREKEVLALLIHGQSVDAISRGLFLGEATVRTHVRGILRKLGVRSQLAAVARAREAGWGVPVHDDTAN